MFHQLYPTLEAFKLSRGSWLFNLANSASVLDRVIRVLYLPAADSEDAFLDSVDRNEFGQTIPIQFARYLDELWACLHLHSSPSVVQVSADGTPVESRGFSHAMDMPSGSTEEARPRSSAGVVDVSRTGATRHFAGPREGHTKAVWVLDVDNAWQPPTLVAGMCRTLY